MTLPQGSHSYWRAELLLLSKPSDSQSSADLLTCAISSSLRRLERSVSTKTRECLRLATSRLQVMSFRGKTALACNYQISRTLDSFLGFPFSLLPCPVTPGSCTQVGCRAPLVSPLSLALASQCQTQPVWMVDCDRGPMGSESPRQDAPSPLFFLRASSLSLGSSFASEGCWLVFKRRQFFTHSSLWSSSIVPQDASSPKGNLCFPLPPWNAQGRNPPFSLFHSRNKRVHNIPLRQWSCLLTQASDASSSFVFTWLCMISSLGRVPNPETLSSGVEGGFLVPRLEVGRGWVTWTWYVEDPLSLFWIIA